MLAVHGSRVEGDVRGDEVRDGEAGAEDEERRVDEVGVARPARGEEVGEGERGHGEGEEGREGAELLAGREARLSKARAAVSALGRVSGSGGGCTGGVIQVPPLFLS